MVPSGSPEHTWSTLYDRIYQVVRRIPKGRVATYGQIAALTGIPGRARQVGYALSALNDDTVPWHRVINAQGAISPRAAPEFVRIQRRLLEAEGVTLDDDDRVPLDQYRWCPRPGSRRR